MRVSSRALADDRARPAAPFPAGLGSMNRSRNRATSWRLTSRSTARTPPRPGQCFDKLKAETTPKLPMGCPSMSSRAHGRRLRSAGSQVACGPNRPDGMNTQSRPVRASSTASMSRSTCSLTNPHEPGFPRYFEAVRRLSEFPTLHLSSETKTSPVHDQTPREAVGIGRGPGRSGDGGARGVERSRAHGFD
jgi:hypothetical protein